MRPGAHSRIIFLNFQHFFSNDSMLKDFRNKPLYYFDSFLDSRLKTYNAM
jgi:hypothetical protein